MQAMVKGCSIDRKIIHEYFHIAPNKIRENGYQAALEDGGSLHSRKGILLYANAPYRQVKVVFSWSLRRIGT